MSDFSFAGCRVWDLSLARRCVSRIFSECLDSSVCVFIFKLRGFSGLGIWYRGVEFFDQVWESLGLGIWYRGVEFFDKEILSTGGKNVLSRWVVRVGISNYHGCVAMVFLVAVKSVTEKCD